MSDVWVAGQRLLRNSQLCTIDQAAVMVHAREWQMKLAAFKTSTKKA